MSTKDPYDPNTVRQLFDDMASTYGVVNLVSSFGFAKRWRDQTAGQVPIPAGAIVADLMSGMGELWPSVRSRNSDVRILAVDISPEMSKRAQDRARELDGTVDVRVGDVLAMSLEPESVDVVLSSFGLKTFDRRQLAGLAGQIDRLLRPGGWFSLTDISVPPNPLLRTLFMAYIQHAIPVIGRVFMGDPDCYRELGRYTRQFGDAHDVVAAFRDAGLEATLHSYFFGCATGVSGMKPGRMRSPDPATES